MNSSNGIKKELAYVCMPALFCVLGYALLWLTLQPVWSLATAAAGTLVSKDAPNFDSQLTSIFDPEAERPQVQQADNGTEGFISGRDIEFPDSGSQYGQIYCERIGLDAPVYWYDSDEILSYGVGQSLASMLPGFGSAIILSAHNTTYFKCLQDIEVGDTIQFETNYCDYEYQVTNVQVYDENELWTLLSEKGLQEEEELIMYTCYPFHAISGRKTQRLTVFAKRTSGLDVKWRYLD